MNSFMVALSLATIVMFLVYLPFRFVYLAREWRITQKYKLFAVRDQLVRLRIEGEFDADPELYDYYCNMCNTLIRHTKELTLQSFVSALRECTPQDMARAEELRGRLKATSLEVRDCIDGLYNAAMNILVENSTLLRTLLRLRAKDSTLKHVGDASQRFGSSRLLAVKEYQEVAKLRSIHLQAA